MTFTQREALYFPVLVAAFLRHNLPPEWGVAIARQESAFVVTASNNSAGDAKRGGSWGLCQISLLTARSLGFTGTTADLLNPEINAELAAALCEEISKRLKTTSLADVASAYNSGKPMQKAPTSTRTVYVPRVLAFAVAYQPRANDLAKTLTSTTNSVSAQQMALPGIAPVAIRAGGLK